MADSIPIPDIVSDRGPAEYFHGRDRILSNFEDLLGDAKKGDNGTIFLIQGAPGVGKTALLDQCGKRASTQDWKVVNIGVGALWDPNNLLASLGLGEKYKGTERSTQIGFENFLGWVWKSARPQPTVKDIIKSGKTPLILILDEAHALGHDKVPPDDHRFAAVKVLEAIHNGMLERPVVLLAAGLGTTKASFETLEISRYKGGCFVELGALSKESEYAVIRDFLVKDGGAKGDTSAWIESIAKQTHGWPQHVIAYADAAVKQIKRDLGIMTSEGLEVVYRVGMERRKAYYRQRVDDFSGDEIIKLAELIANVGSGKPFNKELVMAPLSEKYGPEEAKILFHKFLKKGVIVSDGFLYFVPIPSMHDWMRSELKRTQEKLQAIK